MKLTTFVVMFATVSALGQTSERIEVNLVNVDVTVLDRHGNPVTGLAANDFEVLEDGKLQKITNFSAAALAAPADPAARRVTAIFVEDQTAPGRRNLKYALGKLDAILAGPDDASLWSVIRLWASIPREVVPFTTDRAKVRAALDAIRRGTMLEPRAEAATVPFDPNDDFECETARCVIQTYRNVFPAEADTFAAISQTIRRVGLMAGSRSILVVGTDLPSGDELAVSLIRRANAFNTRVFVLDPSGLAAAMGIDWLPRETGGLFLTGNRIEQSIAQFERAATHFYELGFIAGPDDGRYHRLDVRLLRPGRFSVLHRDGYVRAARNR